MITNSFHRSSKLFGSRTFIEYHEDNICNSKSITYEDAFTVATQHGEWIRDTIQENRSSCSSCGHDLEVVVAYLSHNSPDLILSILGCMGMEHIERKGLQRDHHSAGMNMNRNVNISADGNDNIRVRLAMLNARWSAKEIAQALVVHGNGYDQKRQTSKNGDDLKINDHNHDAKEGLYNHHHHHRLEHMTIIVYSSTLGQVAKEATSILMNSKSNSNLNPTPTLDLTRGGGLPAVGVAEGGQRNVTLAFPLPSLARESIIPKLTQKQHEDTIATSEASSSSPSSLSYEDEAIILFTSGTTSGPKGVKLSHLGLFIQSMAKMNEPCCYDDNTKMLATTVPFFHVGGLSSALAVLIAGGCLVFPSTMSNNSGNGNGGIGNHKGDANSKFSFDPEMVVETIVDKFDMGKRTNIVDTLVIVPAMLHAILFEIKRRRGCGDGRSVETTFEGVRLLLLGGQSLTNPQLISSKEIFPNARIVQTYACTEASSSLTFADIYNPLQKSNGVYHDGGSIGEPKGTYVGVAPPHIELGIFALKSHRPVFKAVPPYTIGAIGTRGPHVMNGYWKRGGNDDNGKGLINQWLITQDLGFMDNEGRLYFCGRLNDVIRTGGETVFAPEVESTLVRHPNIDQCAVFSLPDERFGECVCVAIVLNEDAKNFRFQQEGKSMLPSLRDFCKLQKLTSFKRPRRAFILDALPRNSSGKVLKHELKRILSIQSKL